MADSDKSNETPRRRSKAVSVADLPLPALPPVSAFDALADPVLRFDAELRIVYANAAALRALAPTDGATLIGQPIAELLAVGDDEWSTTLRDTPRRLLALAQRPGGRIVFDVQVSPEPGTGSQRHWTAVLREQQSGQPALADDFAQRLLAAAPIGIGILDRNLRYQAWNAQLEQLLGVSADQVLGRRPDEIPALAGVTEIKRQFEAMREGRLRTTQTVEYPVPVVRSKAVERIGGWVRVRRTPVFGSDGSFSGAFVTVERIEEGRFAETSLVALRQALDSAGEMVIEVLRDGSIVDANETALAWLGYGREFLRGTQLAAIDAALTPERFVEMLEALGSRGSYHGEGRYRTRQGAEFPVDVVLQRVEQDGREFIFLLVRDITGRKRIEQQLTDSVSRLRTIFEESPVAKLLLSPDFRITQANIAACSLLGYNVDQVIGRNPNAFLMPEDEGVWDRLRERLAHGEVSATLSDRRLRHRDGHALWAKLTLRAWYAEDGAARQRHYLAVLEDITERKTSQEQLEVLLADQQTLLATMSVGVAQALNGRILLANREFARMFGYADNEVVGMSLWELARDRANRMPQEVSGLPAVREGQTTSAEVVLFRRDGEPVWCLVQARPVQTPGGASGAAEPLAEAIYTFQDISEMKRQREALRRSLLELNVVLDTTPVAVLHLAADRVIRCNAQASLLFGADNADLVGAHVSSLFANLADYSTHQRHFVPTSSPSPSFEVQLRGAHGRTFWALVTVRLVDSAEGTGGQIMSILDIDDRKLQEAQLQTLLAESRLMFDTALVGLLFVRNDRPVRANAAMEELLGCEPGSLTFQGQFFAHPTDQLLLESLAERYDEIRSRGACEFELEMFRRKGDAIWVAVQGRAVNPEQPGLGYIFAFVNVDERKRSERELRATLSELQLIFDNALVGMAYVADELVVKANAATERMFGYSSRDLRELEIGSLFADRRDWEQMRSQAASGEASFERLMRRADATTFWAAVNVRPLDESAPERGLILTLMDVDMRRRSEDELKRVRNYLDLVVENLPVLVSVRDVQTGRFVSLNRAGEQLTGLPREKVVGRTWHEIYGRQFADLYVELDRKALVTGQQVDRPRDMMLRVDGRTLTVNQRVLPLYEPGPDGSDSKMARYVMSIIDDLTEEVRAEAALRETETRFRQFAENIDQLVFIATAELNAVLYMNPRYPTLVGGTVDEVMLDARAGLKHVHPADVASLRQRIPRLVAEMRRLRKTEITLRIEHPERGARVLSVRLNPVRMFDGSVRVFGIADDVTERIEAERQRIEAAIKQRDILVREVHHRIKNNLQGVAGLLQHMAGNKPEVAEQLNEIAGQIQAIAQVHGMQIRATGTLPVLGVAQSIFTNLSNMFGVEVKFEPPSAALWRWGLPENEAVPLALIINELGTNAIKYRASREQPIGVALRPQAEGIELQIENAGTLKPGFDLAHIASSVSGLGLVKALLPRRGARLSIETLGPFVVTRLMLTPPAVGEDQGT